VSRIRVSGNGAIYVSRLVYAGRGGNSWTSPEGCLMFSFITRYESCTEKPRDGRAMPYFTLRLPPQDA